MTQVKLSHHSKCNFTHFYIQLKVICDLDVFEYVSLNELESKRTSEQQEKQSQRRSQAKD